MIIREFYRTRQDGVNLYKTYSDVGVYIQKENDDFKYAQAIDVETATFVYIETDIQIEKPLDFKNPARKED